MATLPAELFARRGVWVIAGLPVSESDDIPIDRLYTTRGQHTFLPLFTSERAARDHATQVFGPAADGYATLTFDGIRRLGELLDAAALTGIQYVTFDPKPGGGSPSFAIGDVAGAVHEHLNRPSAN
jgi:hypothetical protein